MFGEIKAAIAGTAGILILVFGLAFGLLAGGVGVRAYDAWFIIPAAERAAADAATTSADARWQKLIDKAKDEAALARRNAETKIAEAERTYFDRDRARVAQMTALERTLEQELADVPIPSPADRLGVCRPAVSRGVRDALQDLGRDGPRAHPAEPDPAVRSGH